MKINPKNLSRGLIVSCQAVEGEPLYNTGIMHLFARAAFQGGACGIRALAGDVDSISKEVGLPVIGLVKQSYRDSEVYITPTEKEVDILTATGCDVICMDATDRLRPQGKTLEEIYAYARQNADGRALMADISTIEEATRAEELGFDYISTTLRGFTERTKNVVLPDIDFIAQCMRVIKRAKVIAEGGICEPAQLKKISEINPFAVVIGTAITRPKDITERFVRELKLA